MSQVAVWGTSIPDEVCKALDSCGLAWKSMSSKATVERLSPQHGWLAAVIAADAPDDIVPMCRFFRTSDPRVEPIVVVLPENWLPALPAGSDIFDDYIVLPATTAEIESRIQHAIAKVRTSAKAETLTHGDLVLNLTTYQAAIADKPLDLTYMEYELLRFFASHPDVVFSRQELLQRVWGYEYFGGGRTVDVHVRRLRAKIGEEHAHLIQTVRSVGYLFGVDRVD
jgi:two-component system, OmpR family, alkaline phosphatase synthesis response regulator PhoP